MEIEVDEFTLQSVLDYLLSSLSSLLKAHTQSQQMLRLRLFEKWSFSDSIARAKKLIEATESVMKQINAKVLDALAFREANPELRIWERFRMRMVEQLNNFDGETDLFAQYAANIFEGSRLQSMFQYLIKQNLALVKELYEAIYQFELKKAETYKKYQLKMCKPEEFRRQFQKQSDYDMLFIRIRMTEVFSTLPVLNCEITNISDVMADLEIQYHKTLQENIDNIEGNMRARNQQIIKAIDKYKVDYQNYKKREPRAFFKSSLRYQNLNNRKTIRLSLLKAFYRTLPGNSPVPRKSVKNEQESAENSQFSKTVNNPLIMTMSSNSGNNDQKLKSFWGEVNEINKAAEQSKSSIQKQNKFAKSNGSSPRSKQHPKSQHQTKRSKAFQSKFFVNKSVRSKMMRKYLTIPTTPNYLQLQDQCVLEDNESYKRKERSYQTYQLPLNEVKISYHPEIIEQQDQVLITKAMPKGKPILGKAYLLKNPAYSSIHDCQQNFAKAKTPSLSIIITHNANLHLKRKTIEMLRYGKYINHTRNHELVLM